MAAYGFFLHTLPVYLFLHCRTFYIRSRTPCMLPIGIYRIWCYSYIISFSLWQFRKCFNPYRWINSFYTFAETIICRVLDTVSDGIWHALAGYNQLTGFVTFQWCDIAFCKGNGFVGVEGEVIFSIAIVNLQIICSLRQCAGSSSLIHICSNIFRIFTLSLSKNFLPLLL